jgi:hypothetical protein
MPPDGRAAMVGFDEHGHPAELFLSGGVRRIWPDKAAPAPSRIVSFAAILLYTARNLIEADRGPPPPRRRKPTVKPRKRKLRLVSSLCVPTAPGETKEAA